jgi:hypothetical protein
MEKHYTFIKNNRVENNAVFAEEDNDLAERICLQNNYDSFIWLNTRPVPALWSTYDGIDFTPPTQEYLISIGVITPVVEETPAE